MHAPAIVTASNRAGMIYTDEPRVAAGEPRQRSRRSTASSSSRTAPSSRARRRRGSGDPRLVSARPRARRGGAAQPERRRGARLRRAGLGARRPRRHAPRGGGSHGSLGAGDSEVPMLGDRHRAARADDRRQGRDARGRALGRAVIDARQPHGRAAARPARHPRRARARGDGDACRASSSCRRSSRPRLRRRGAPDRRGQTISQPAMVALICELLALRGDERVLDVGTGSGYQAAVLAELAARGAHDRAPARARRTCAREPRGRRLRDRVVVHVGDGTLGDPEHAPFAAIAVAAAAPDVPAPSTNSWSRTGGSCFPWAAASTSCSSSSSARRRRPEVVRSVPCRFVPLVGREGFAVARRECHVAISGRVQGVGFRYATRSERARAALPVGAQQRGRHRRSRLRGSAGAGGRVGSWCRRGPAGARVDDVRVELEAPSDERGFRAG